MSDLLNMPQSDPATPFVLEDARWPLYVALRKAGVTDAGIWRLIQLRGRIGDPALDGAKYDRRLEFARWLVARGILNEGCHPDGYERVADVSYSRNESAEPIDG